MGGSSESSSGRSSASSTGGSSGHHASDAREIRCAVITVSDTRTPDSDTSGGEIRSRLAAAGHVVVASSIVADEAALVRREVERHAASGLVDVVLLTGGTGIAARDTTFEAVAAMLTKTIDGFGELFRVLSS